MGSNPPLLFVVLSVSLVIRRLIVDSSLRFGLFITEHSDRNIEVEESEDDIGDVDCEPDPIDRPSGGEPQERQREPRRVTEDGYPRALLYSSDGENRKLTMRFASAEKGKTEHTRMIEPSPYPL